MELAIRLANDVFKKLVTLQIVLQNFSPAPLKSTMAADDYHPISKHGKTTAASAVSPSSIKKPKERVPAKPDMPEINCYLMCQLCSGYLIDATAIIECQHTFCKSCILKYLETNSYCPICDVQLNKAKPHLSLRSDVIIQRLVYKLVPGLLVSEIRRRRDFSIKNGMDPVEAAELASNSIAAEIEASSDLSTVLSLDDVVSLSVEYFRSRLKAPSSHIYYAKQFSIFRLLHFSTACQQCGRKLLAIKR
ncbi:Polycomb complex protein BMI-1 [Orchesella cincta]|uniref:Polycomb complex protein BMI-1 n=1 Tax=Orchesella cincta TaxID=48709 RepID=A0A1D2NKX3_ORCCI|nr:Polycomb complex protein BMI-1 [Orchesella cincta]